MRNWHSHVLYVVLLTLFGISISFAQWIQTGAISISNGFGSTTATALVITRPAAGDTDLFVGANQGGNNAIFESTNDGVSWSEKYYFGATSPGSVNTFALSDTNIFAGTASGIYLSTNNFASWRVIDSGLTSPNVAAFAISGSNIFAGILPSSTYITVPPYVVNAPGGVCLSTNKGVTWSVVDSGLTNASNTDVSALATVGNIIVAGTSDNSGIFRSTNNGTTWASANTGLFTVVGDSTQYVQIHAFATIGSTIFAGTDQGIFRSTDNGASWNSASTGIPLNEFQQFPAVGCLASAGTNLFAGMNGETPGGVYLSTNSGASWTWTDSGAVGIHVTSLVASGNYVYAVSESGVWKLLLSQTGNTAVTTGNAGVAKAFALSQNYPNPFNPTTMISYQLPAASRVSLKVYDMVGRQVATLVNGQMEAGAHQVSFDASRLASGVYFYQLQAGSFVASKKLVLLK